VSARDSQRQSGQALVEFSIVSVLVLVPLILLVNVLGIFGDIRHTTIQAARYQAWEYTAWNWSTPSQADPPRFQNWSSKSRLPRRTPTQVRARADALFFAPSDVGVVAPAGTPGAAPVLPSFWTDPTSATGRSLVIAGPNSPSGSVTDQFTAPANLANNVASKINNGIQWVMGAIGTITNWANTLTFGLIHFDTVNEHGPIRAEVQIQANYPQSLRAPQITLADEDPTLGLAQPSVTFRASAGLLVDTWGTAGRDHTVYESGGLVFTKALFDNPVFQVVQTVASVLTVSPELNRIQGGYIDVDAVPKDRLSTNATTNPPSNWPSCSAGLCE
jgi:hypothetical protein